MCANKCRNADGWLNSREFNFSTPNPTPKKKLKKKEPQLHYLFIFNLIDIEDVHGHYGHT